MLDFFKQGADRQKFFAPLPTRHTDAPEARPDVPTHILGELEHICNAVIDKRGEQPRSAVEMLAEVLANQRQILDYFERLALRVERIDGRLDRAEQFALEHPGIFPGYRPTLADAASLARRAAEHADKEGG